MKALIVDDHPVARRGLRSLLVEWRSDAEIWEAGDSATALRLATENQPKLVLLDLRMPASDPSNVLCARLSAVVPTARIALVTAFEEVGAIKACLASGAHGCLRKDVDPDILLSAIRRIAAGEEVIDARLQQSLTQEYVAQLRGKRSPAHEMTRREREVLALLAEGYTNRMIAETLCIAENTVKGYVMSVREKLDARSRLDAVVRAARQKLI